MVSGFRGDLDDIRAGIDRPHDLAHDLAGKRAGPRQSAWQAHACAGKWAPSSTPRTMPAVNAAQLQGADEM